MDAMVQSALSRLPDIDDVEPFDSDDQSCLDEIRNVLERHGRLERFGITLLHEHFEVADDEVLVETIDIENRTLTCRPMKRSDVGESVQTMWRLDGPRGEQRCERQCQQDRDFEGKPYHRGAHYTTG